MFPAPMRAIFLRVLMGRGLAPRVPEQKPEADERDPMDLAARSTMVRAMIDRDTLARALSTTLDQTSLDALGHKYEGKVRDNYTTKDGRRYIVVTDRISAFDRVIGTLPLKGQVLNRMASYWFEETRHVAPNHMISMPDPTVLEARECEPLPVEMVVRAYVTGVTS